MADPVGYVLQTRWDLSHPDARCTIEELEERVYQVGLDKYGGWPGLHMKMWMRDGDVFSSIMVFDSASARVAGEDSVMASLPTVTGLRAISVEHYTAIAIIEGGAGFSVAP